MHRLHAKAEKVLSLSSFSFFFLLGPPFLEIFLLGCFYVFSNNTLKNILYILLIIQYILLCIIFLYPGRRRFLRWLCKKTRLRLQHSKAWQRGDPVSLIFERGYPHNQIRFSTPQRSRMIVLQPSSCYWFAAVVIFDFTLIHQTYDICLIHLSRGSVHQRLAARRRRIS